MAKPSQNEERDDKYWERRRKNNFAAKKSRDARKVRENQLNLKVACLENANTGGHHHVLWNLEL